MAKKVVIDPGHGGEDPGTSANGIVEKDYTLKISEYMANRLSDLGIQTALTRDSDVTLDSTNRPKKAQSLFGTGNDVILVSNHINAGGGDGAEIIYALRNSDNLSSKIAQEFIKSGQNVRKYYQRRLPSNSSKDYYYILRETPNNESIIVEYGFADSTGDDVDQIKNNWQDLAEAVVRALADYIGVSYIPPEGAEEIYYTVKKGDTLYGIAKQFGISVDELKISNYLTNNTLRVGQTLVIPKIEESDSTYENKYIVKKGDTLYSIAKRYGMTVDEIKQLNHLTSDILSVGQVLNISNNNDSSSDSDPIYIVKKGDSLYSIARKFGITVDDLMKTNGKTSNLISIGESLVIPLHSNTHKRTYEVQTNDSLWKIAQAYGTSVNAIKKANGLTSDLLSIGQVLVIP